MQDFFDSIVEEEHVHSESEEVKTEKLPDIDSLFRVKLISRQPTNDEDNKKFIPGQKVMLEKIGKKKFANFYFIFFILAESGNSIEWRSSISCCIAVSVLRNCCIQKVRYACILV